MNTRNGTRLPVRLGQEFELVIHGIGHSGEGVGRWEGLTVFVPGGVPGDRLSVRVTDTKKRYARATILRVLEESVHRVTPICPVVGECGGCQLQHIAYGAQLDLKRQQVVDAMSRIGKLDNVLVHPTLGMEEPWEYRNKGQFPAGQRGSEVIIGFFAPGSHRVVDIQGCAIQHPVANQIMREVKNLAATYGVPIYDIRTHSGVVRHVVARVGKATGEAMAVLVTNGSDFPEGPRIAEDLMERIPALVSVVHNVNSERTTVVLGAEFRVLAGQGHITDRIGGYEFVISPSSFFQVNSVQTELLYSKVLEYAALRGHELVLDLYCGIGTITLLLAEAASSVIGIEWVQDAVDDARKNADLNGVENVKFVAGDVTTELAKLATRREKVDVIVVDPPRKGCDGDVLDAMAQMTPTRIVYVSCNPASLARDVAVLHRHGYQTVEVQPIDMFPHTSHVECCALLVRSDLTSRG